MAYAFPSPPAAHSPSSSSSPPAQQEDAGFSIVLEPDDEDKSPANARTDPHTATPEPSTARGDTMKELQVPIHPISSMQGAFAESIQDASGASTPKAADHGLGTAAARRQRLIDQDISEETHAARWRAKPGQRYHQLWKLMAQISFGIYLLLNGMARDENQVMLILQGHVDEVDEFLETTLEDFDLAQEDIAERLKFLKLPLENIVIFDAMLEDRAFRLQIVNGNERIEHVIQRTAEAMNDALKDVKQGLDACKEFGLYLAQEFDSALWREENPEMERVIMAMRGNVDGWTKAYVSLQTKGNHLGVALVQLGSIVAEMDRRAGEVSRKTRFSSSHSGPIMPPASPPRSPPRVSAQMRLSMLKTLPADPNMITPAIQATLPAFQLVQDRERTPEPEARPEDSTPQNLTPRASTPEAVPEEEYILAPRTYTPVPSPKPRHVPQAPQAPPALQAPAQEVAPPEAAPPEAAPPEAGPPEAGPPEAAPPEIGKRSSLAKRFSLKRKETPQEIVLQPTPPRTENNIGPHPPNHTASAPRSCNIPRKMVAPSLSSPAPQDRSTNTPPSRGLDSAYSSDLDRPQLNPTLSDSPRMPSGRLDSPPVLSRGFSPSPRIPPGRLDSPPVLSRGFSPSPRLPPGRLDSPPVLSRGFSPSPRMPPERLDSPPVLSRGFSPSPRMPPGRLDSPPVLSQGILPSPRLPPGRLDSPPVLSQGILPSPRMPPGRLDSPPVLSQGTLPSPRMPPGRLDSPPVLSQGVLPSPLSDQQYFRPVNASPHSPLQRPWTAGPTSHHFHSNSNGSNGSYTPSKLGNRWAAPSATGMSVMSDVTTVTENGKKVKKKGSTFGWLRKAFVLSEEEKLAFEERRRKTDWEENLYNIRPPQKWIDGRRVR